MPRKMKKGAESIAFHLRKAYWRIITLKPSVWIVGSLLICIAIFMIGGGIFNLMERPLVAGAYQMPGGEPGPLLFHYPYGIHGQFIAESVLVIILYSLGVAGLLMVYQSTKHAYKPRQAYIMLTVGLTLILISYIVIESIFTAWK